MIPALLLGKALSALSGLGSWLKTLPWYVFVIGGVLVYALWERHEADKNLVALQTAKQDTDAWIATDKVDRASVATLKGAVAAQNTATDALRAQTAAMQLAAASARTEAAQAAQGRASALAALKSAQAKPIANDCAAPAAHLTAKDQL